MIYDERHGWVERGTKGHRASAQVESLATEIMALAYMHDKTELRGCQHDRHIMRDLVRAQGDQMQHARVARHEEWCEVILPTLSDERPRWAALHYLRMGYNRHYGQMEAWIAVQYRLAALAPCYAVVADGQRKRMERGLSDDV